MGAEAFETLSSKIPSKARLVAPSEASSKTSFHFWLVWLGKGVGNVMCGGTSGILFFKVSYLNEDGSTDHALGSVSSSLVITNLFLFWDIKHEST